MSFQFLDEERIYKFAFYFFLSNPMTKSNLGRKGFIWLTPPNLSPSLREARLGAKAEAMEEHRLLD